MLHPPRRPRLRPIQPEEWIQLYRPLVLPTLVPVTPVATNDTTVAVTPATAPAIQASKPAVPINTALPVHTAPTANPTAIAAAVNPINAPCTNPHLDEAWQGQSPNLNALPHFKGVVKLPLINQSLCSALPAPTLKASYGLNGAPRIGIQIGHYQIDQLPEDLASLRGQTGGSGGGVREVDVNQDVARRVAALLTAKGATVDVLPATVPDGYTADAFIAIHADASLTGNPRGYKLARSRFSAIPTTDDALLNNIFNTYGEATGLPTDSSITRNMTGYYAFNARNRLHAISKNTPAVIIEMGFLTSAADRNILLGRTELVAEGIAEGVWNFVQNRPVLEKREKPIAEMPAIEAANDDTAIYDAGNAIIAYVGKGQLFEYFENSGSNYSIYVPILRKRGYIRKADINATTVPR